MIHNCKAIILKKRAWGETDLLLSLLSENGERIDAIAKGAGNGKSKRRSHLELMNKVSVTLYKNEKHHYLQEAVCLESFFRLKKDFKRVFEAQVLLEAIEKSLAPEDPHPSAYELLENTLLHLNEPDAHPLSAEIGLLKWGEMLGILPHFHQCGACHKGLETEAHWNHDKQILLCEKCKESKGETLELKYRKALEFFKNAPLHECKRIKLKEEEDAKLRELIPYFFRHHLNQPLKSIAWTKL